MNQEVESAARCWRRRRAGQPTGRRGSDYGCGRRLHPWWLAPCRSAERARLGPGAANDGSLQTAGCFRRGGGGLAEVAGVLAVRRVPRPELVLLKQPRFGYYLQNNRDPINCFTATWFL